MQSSPLLSLKSFLMPIGCAWTCYNVRNQIKKRYLQSTYHSAFSEKDRELERDKKKKKGRKNELIKE
jgi:hypothetical protein